MTVQELTQLVENRLRCLEQLRQASWNNGDVAGVTSADTQIAETQLTLDQLRTLA
jgi:hypothetical protein